MPKLTPTTIANSSLGFALALFLGRVLGETIFSGQLLLILGLTAVLSVILMVSFRPLSFQQSWPLSILWLYVLWPTPRLDLSVIVGFTAVVALIFNQFNQPHAQQYLPQKRLLPPILLTFALLASFALYLLTLAPDLLPADNGEFQLIGATLGLAHPPGFPLYTLLAHGATWLPLPLTAGAKINLLSVLLATATLALLALTSHQLSPHRPTLTAGLVILALATSTTFWAQAVMANIRIPTALLATLAFYALLRFQAAVTDEEGHHQADRWLTLWSLTMSLGLTHHLSLAFIALVMGGFALWVDPTLLRMPKRWTRPCLAALLGLLPLLYLPLADPTLRQPAEFFSYALGLGFQGDFFYFHTPAQLWQRAGVMLNIFTFQFQPLILLGAMGGFLLLLWHNRPRAFLLGGSLLLHTFIVATYRAPQAVEYMLPAYVPLVLLLGYSLSELSNYAKKWGMKPVGVLFYAALLTTAVFTQLVTHWPSYRFLSQSQDTAVYTDHILTHAPPDSVVLANWHWVTPLWYEQEVNGRRPDLEIVYLYPQTADYGADWATRIERELEHGRAVVATFYDENSYQQLPPSQPLGEAYLFPNAPLLTLPPTFTPLSLTGENGLTIHGYQLAQEAVEMGQEATLMVAWTPPSKGDDTAVSLYAHLVAFDGRLVAQDDHHTAVAQPDGLTLTQFRLTPRTEAQPGDHALFIGTPADPATRTQIGTLTVLPRSFPPTTQNPTYQQMNGQILVGHDWDNSVPNQPRLYLHWRLGHGQYLSEVRDLSAGVGVYELPEVTGVWGFSMSTALFSNPGDTVYVPLGQGMVWWGSRPCLCTLSPLEPGQNVTIQQRFTASRPIQRDIGFSVRLLGFAEDNFSWQWRTPDSADSDIPALGGIPTLKWLAGSEIMHPRTLQVDPQATPSQTVGGMVRPYDVFTNRPIPILDERIATSSQPWLPLVPGHVGDIPHLRIHLNNNFEQ